MGNCLGFSHKFVSTTNALSGPSTSKASRSTTTTGTLSTSSGSTFEQSTSSGVTIDEVFPDGRILEAPNLRTFTFAELRQATKNFKPDTVLGEGGFGKVFKGWLDEKTFAPSKSGLGMVVAVKRLDSESMQGLEEWQSEVNSLGSLSHPNLVRLLGYCWEEKELLLVYEFMTKGSLENHLFRKGSSFETLSWNLRLKIAIGAARCLAFLHSLEKRIIYRDFKASNILLDSNYNAKLSDFGLAKNGPMGSKSHVTTRILGTYGYAAPEYVATGHLYVKSDVYGFGVVLLEMLSGRRALDPRYYDGQYSLVEWAKPFLAERRKLPCLMDPRLDGEYPLKGAFQAAQLTLRCLAGVPKSRPSMKEVVETLEEIESGKGHLREPKGVSHRNKARSHGKAPVHPGLPPKDRYEGHGTAHASNRSPKTRVSARSMHET
ncbi:hypothetical protein HPP92_008377 [Vanilla planifolia]|uniref:non-specific serine/threonine protein kinase n=1 Tax=Vanilla planifolia TaxID=51239 RepID=A0A835V4E9_VANPL|nr:hypothetical protein HPP92_008377 [Vanilla planifolia]